MPAETWLIFILCFMIIASIAALEMKDILSSIITVGVVGLGVSLAFLILQAPDLAIVQFLFEIFALIILVRAFTKKEYHKEKPSRINNYLVVVSIIILGLVFILTLPILEKMPEFGKPLMITSQYYLDFGAVQTGAANLVAAIILDYRAYDTLGEVTILFTAVLGALTILRLSSKSSKEVKE